MMKAAGIGAVILTSFCLALPQQRDAQFETWMKTTGKAADALSKLEPKTGKEVVGSAERIAGVYEEMIGYWRQREAKDAVKWSEQGKAAAVQLASAAHAGDSETAAAAYKTLGGTCRPCHTQYREKLADGTYRIKLESEDEGKKK